MACRTGLMLSLKPLSSTLAPEEECPICKDAYTTGFVEDSHFPMETKCNHTFGLSCIEAWLSVPGARTCPMCRTDLYTTHDCNDQCIDLNEEHDDDGDGDETGYYDYYPQDYDDSEEEDSDLDDVEENDYDDISFWTNVGNLVPIMQDNDHIICEATHILPQYPHLEHSFPFITQFLHAHGRPGIQSCPPHIRVTFVVHQLSDERIANLVESMWETVYERMGPWRSYIATITATFNNNNNNHTQQRSNLLPTPLSFVSDFLQHVPGLEHSLDQARCEVLIDLMGEMVGRMQVEWLKDQGCELPADLRLKWGDKVKVVLGMVETTQTMFMAPGYLHIGGLL